MTETTELKNTIMYLACTIHKKPVRDCVNCANRNDCEILREDINNRLKKGGFKWDI